MPMIAFALAVAGCTGGGDSPGSNAVSTAPSATDAPVASDVGDVAFVPGEFAYNFNDIRATMSMEGSEGTLDVQNRSGDELGKPGVYVIAGDGKRYEGTVEVSAPIADGREASFQVTFPGQVTPDSVGLAVLLFGGSNVGAMAPVPS